MDGDGMYDVVGESGNGLVTVHVAGMGTMAGPPARLTESVVAGRALATVAKAAAISRLVVVCTIIFGLLSRFSGAVCERSESRGGYYAYDIRL